MIVSGRKSIIFGGSSQAFYQASSKLFDTGLVASFSALYCTAAEI
jgi:hypothetical protein